MNQECQFWPGVPCHARQLSVNPRLFSSLFQQRAWPKATDSPRQRAFLSFPCHSGKPNKSSLGQSSQSFQEHNPNYSTQTDYSTQTSNFKTSLEVHTHTLYARIQACTWASTLPQSRAGDVNAPQEQSWHAQTSRHEGRHPARLCLSPKQKKIQLWFQFQPSFQLYQQTLTWNTFVFKTEYHK